MVVKVYVSGMSGNKEVKKRQQRVLMILDSKSIKYDVIDITEPGKESEKEMMQGQSKCKGATVSDPNPRHPLPPQLFYDAEYCGDYDQFDLANEVDTLEQFLKLSPKEITPVSKAEIELNGGGEDKKEEQPSKTTTNGSHTNETESEESSPSADPTTIIDDVSLTTTEINDQNGDDKNVAATDSVEVNESAD